MSKAFTKEDDGDTPAESIAPRSLPTGPFRLTRTGARQLERTIDPATRGALALAEILAPVRAPTAGVLGATMRVRYDDGAERALRLVSPEERALTGEGCSVASPLGRALVGARAGDVREVVLPKGVESLEVVAIDGEEP